ncbi:uncharacterized protein DEA37_0007081 [Paragonimus westermani]|uniref:Uncharacterized protein n=1 Tax=Paragonimus westermani TaxID=34504 RepID=A0A5J4N583_9TREM|nr:uncharacterized protein DEA37_0007081 [Paragonimus westermani]
MQCIRQRGHACHPRKTNVHPAFLPSSHHGDFNTSKLNSLVASHDSYDCGFSRPSAMMIHEKAWTQHVDLPTRQLPGQTPSLLNLVITDEADLVYRVVIKPPLGHSDHMPLAFDFICYWFQSAVTKTPSRNFQKGDRHSPASYRPISLTSIPCKIMEQLLKRTIFKYLFSNKLFSSTQCDFLLDCSCITNMLIFADSPTKARDNGHISDAIFFDFAEAFDRVPHGPLYDPQLRYLDVLVADAASLGRLLRLLGVNKRAGGNFYAIYDIGLVDAILTDSPYGFRESSCRVAGQAVEHSPGLVTPERLSEITDVPLRDASQVNLDEQSLIKHAVHMLYGVYIRPLLEYANQFVYTGSKKEILASERVQRVGTKMVTGLRHSSHGSCFEIVDLYPLAFRRLRGDFILTRSVL